MTVDVDHVDVIDVLYQPPTAGLPIEVFQLSSLMERRTREELSARQRIHFDLLIHCADADARHEVDFEQVDLGSNQILHVRPGQVHRWIFDPRYDATLILLRPLDNRRNWKPGPHLVEIDEQTVTDLDDLLRFARRSDGRLPLPRRGLEGLRDLVVAVLRLDDIALDAITERERIYADFERLLGGPELPPRSVGDCAQRLGCSTRTLTRACHAAAGVAPKQLIDKTIALEAQRRLSVGSVSSTQVAESLGFVELSHFSRFFTRVTGESPSSFAASYAASPGP